MKAIVLDDEKYAGEALYHLLERYCPEIKPVILCTDPEKAIEVFHKESPDLLFLDVEMPHMTGFDFLHALGPHQSSVIFTTAYDTYAIQAFKVNAVDYLLKPVDASDLRHAVQKVQQKANPITGDLLTSLIRSAMEQQQSPRRISIHTLEGIHLLALDDIIACRSEGSYSMIILRSQPTLLVSRNLTEMEELIASPRFFRVHKSHLVNRDHILKVNKSEGGDVIMSNQDHIPVSRQRRAEFFEWLGK